MSERSEERTYYLRTVCMYMDLTKDTLLKLFKYLINSDDITRFLTSVDTHRKLLELFKGGILNKTEYNLVCSSWPDPEKFDIALLIRLILGLCRDRIPEPKLGWKNRPQPKDECLGADLIRLRDVRNKLIGHRADPKLSQAEYHKIWYKVQAILERVIDKIDPQSKTNFSATLIEYKELEVHTEKTKVKRYLDQLNEYKNDVEKLQNKVEELSKKSKEFDVYFERTPERYVRYIKLLFDGGRLVLCGVFERELHKHGQGLGSLLLENREILQSNVDREYQSYLFPLEPNNIDHKSWDVDLLASVILLVSTDISADDIRNIEQIKCARRNYADHALSCLDEDQFLEIWTDLISNLKHLSMNIDEDKKQQIESLINMYKKKSADDNADEYLDRLRKSGVPVKTLTGIHSETVYQLRQLLMQLDERGVKFKTGHVLELKILTTCQNEENKKHAEDFLENHLAASLYKSDIPTNFIGMETDKFFESITTHPDVKPTGIKRKCIILSFKSLTPGGLLHLLDYFNSQHFNSRLHNISNELSYLYEDAFLLLGYVTLESMSNISNVEGSKLHKRDMVCSAGSTEDESEKGIILPLTCSSVEGMRHVLATLKCEKTANRLNSIADKISVQLKGTVTINVSPDLLEFRDVFEETDSKGLSSCGYCENDGVDRYLEQDKSNQSISAMTETLKHLPLYGKQLSIVSQESSSNDEETPDFFRAHFNTSVKKDTEHPMQEDLQDQSVHRGDRFQAFQKLYGKHLSIVSQESSSNDEETPDFFSAHFNTSLKKDKEHPMQEDLQDQSVHRGDRFQAFQKLYGKQLSIVSQESSSNDEEIPDFFRAHFNKSLKKDTEHPMQENLLDPWVHLGDRFQARQKVEMEPRSHCCLRHRMLSVKREDEDSDMSSEHVEETTDRVTECEKSEYQQTKLQFAQGSIKTNSLNEHFDTLFRKAEKYFQKMLKNTPEVTEEDVKALKASIEDLFHLQIDDTTVATNYTVCLGRRDNSDQAPERVKKEYKRRLKQLRKDFTTFKRGIMKELVTEDELYLTKKQELRYYLVQTYKNTHGVYGGRSVLRGLPRLYSIKRGYITTYGEIFYDMNRKCKNICIFGEERLATEVCLDVVNAWCEPWNETMLKEFEFVFMISLCDTDEEVCIHDMVKKHLLRGEYSDIFEKVIDRESENCLIILDGISQWKAKKCSYSDMPERHLMDYYVVLMTASYGERIENTDQVLYLG